jgi:hypothetical protein
LSGFERLDPGDVSELQGAWLFLGLEVDDAVACERDAQKERLANATPAPAKPRPAKPRLVKL